MTNPRNASRASGGDDRQHALRQIGAHAHQLRAATRAADHFIARQNPQDGDTGAWLMSTAVSLAEDLAAEIDGLARAIKDGPPDAALAQTVAALRVRAHQLHAAARAADHFLEQDSHEDRDTGSWLIATALSLATRLASEIDDSTVPARGRGNGGAGADEPAEVPARRVSAAA
jgi:hypothetical protein